MELAFNVSSLLLTGFLRTPSRLNFARGGWARRGGRRRSGSSCDGGRSDGCHVGGSLASLGGTVVLISRLTEGLESMGVTA